MRLSVLRMRSSATVATLLGVASAAFAAPFSEPAVRLESDAACLTMALKGGAFVGFQPAGADVNPLSWALTEEEMPDTRRGGAPFRGHFLCLGRWGSPSPGERAAGVPHNGEPAALTWQTWAEPGAVRESWMQVEAPLEQWTVRRRTRISAASALVRVDETFTNGLPIARFTAIVQHATLAPPFLASDTLIDCNAGPGFNQALVREGVIQQAYRWPAGVAAEHGEVLDLRRCDAAQGYVSTHVIDGEWGWVTAASPGAKWMIGYLWQTREYPWLHLWHGVRDGRVWARGLEFGTTGLGDTVSPEVRTVTTFAGRNHLLFVDARAAVTRSFRIFLTRIPGDFVATRTVETAGDGVVVEFLTTSGARRVALPWGD